MKQIIKTLLLMLAFITQSAYANAPVVNKDVQTTTSLDSMLSEYKKVILSGDSVKALDFTFPAVFNTSSKEQLIQMIKQQESTGAPKPKISNITQTATLPIKKYAKGEYTLVNYEMDMQMNLAQPGKEKEMEEMLKDPKELASFQKMMKGMLSASLGEDASIEFEKNSFLANVHQKSKYIAINEDNKGWKIVELSVATSSMLDKILPKEIFATYKNQIETLKSKAKSQMETLMNAMNGQ